MTLYHLMNLGFKVLFYLNELKMMKDCANKHSTKTKAEKMQTGLAGKPLYTIDSTWLEVCSEL